jgi:radical SAM superfamily enzyme YgiQ (UPF0313 family)
MPDGLNPAFFDVHPHLGLTSLAAAARQEGHEVAIYDPKREVRFGRRAYDRYFYEAASEDILQTAPESVGFTTLGCSFLFAVRVAELIKRREPDLPIMLGGPHATMLDRRILETYRQFDIAVRNEAEQTLPLLLAKLPQRSFDAIPGITWRECSGKIRSTPGMPRIEDLDQLPIPLYDLYPVRELGLKLMRVEAGRGCPFSCTFCSTATFFQRSYRLKSPQRLVSEMDLLHTRYGVIEFKLDHDLFTVDRRKVRAFCEAVRNKNYRWRASARTDCIDEELLESMAMAGCIGLYFGIETGSHRMQRISEKRLKLEGVEPMLDLAQSLGIESTVSFITGYPEETREDQDATLDMLGRCFQRPEPWCLPQLHVLLPEPGTAMFAQHAQSLAYDGYVTPFNARVLKEDDIDHILSHPALYATYYYYPASMHRTEYTFVVDAVDALRVVGHEILSYSLRFYEGRLSRLIADFRRWVGEKRQGEKVRPALAVDFISDTMGPDHHLTSLFRFGSATGTRDFEGVPAPLSSDEDAGERGSGDLFRLNPECIILENLHDCHGLMNRIRRLPPNAPTLDDGDTGGRACYVIAMDKGKSVHYRLEPGTETLLGLFAEPRRISDVLGLLQAIAPAAADQSHFLSDLAEFGVLIRAGGVKYVRAEAGAAL